MGLDLPPIYGEDFVKKADLPDPESDEDEEFDFEDIPFKADYKYVNGEEIKEQLQNDVKVFGEPAASLTWGLDGNRMIPALEAGKDGEKQTAKLLNKMAEEHSALFAFHSLSWPESSGDTDHILVYGDLIIVIDSKRWKSARKYSVTANGAIMRGTVMFPAGKVRIGNALHVWRKKFPTHKVIGIVTIAQEKVYVTRDRNWYKAPYRLVEHDKLEEFLTDMFAKYPAGKVSGNALVKLGLLLVKERDRIGEIIRVGGEERKGDLPVSGSLPDVNAPERPPTLPTP